MQRTTMINDDDNSSNVIFTRFLWVIPRLCWMILLSLTIVWIIFVEGGFGFDLTSTFGWHALFMIMAGPVCLSEALLTLSLSRSIKLHLILHLASMIFTIL